MEELVPKMPEYGALAIINVLLIFKGVKAMQELTSSIDKLQALTSIVDKLADKVDKIADRQGALENEIKFLSNRFEKLESRFESGLQEIRDVLERRIKNAKGKDS